MSDLVLSLGPYRFEARLESSAAPRTCAAFRGLLPFLSQVIHVRWSGEAVWAPLGDLSIGVAPENEFGEYDRVFNRVAGSLQFAR